MRKLIFPREPVEPVREEDVERIVKAFAQFGWEVEPKDAEDAWRAYSASSSANWVHVPRYSDDIFYMVRPYLEEPE